MKEILQFLARESRWPLIVLVIGVLLLFARLGSYGFWEPNEIRVADSASERVGLDTNLDRNKDQGAKDTGKPGQPPRQAPRDSQGSEDVKPHLTEWSAGQGMKLVERSELGARLPLAFLGLLALVATFFLGKRLASPRAGLIAALVLPSFPLFLFQSRQLMSHIGVVTGSAFVVLGLVGLAWPEADRGARALGRLVLDVALVVVGAVLCYCAAAAFMGIVVPFGAVALACLGQLAGQGDGDTGAPAGPGSAEDRPEPRPRTGLVIAGLGLLGAELVFALVISLTGRHVDDWLAPLLGPTLVGVILFVMGMMPHRAPAEGSAGARRTHWRVVAVGVAASAAALAALYVVLAQAFDLREPVPEERALFGYSFLPAEEPSTALGGTWRLRDDLESTFDVLFEQLAFGLFPWIALAPVALAYLAMGKGRRGRTSRTFSGYVIFGWAALAWIVTSIMMRKVDAVLFPALVPVALAIGLWLDDLMSARDRADAAAEAGEADAAAEADAGEGMPLRPPLAALFALLIVVVVAKDIATFPDKLVSLTALDDTLKYPADTKLLWIKLKVWPAALGVLFAMALVLGLVAWTRHKLWHAEQPWLYELRRHGIHAALGMGVVFALFMTQCWTPMMSTKLSSKHIFSVYRDLRGPGEALAIMGNYGSGPRYYAGGDFEKLTHRHELITFLGRPERVFALAPAAELCAIHREAKGDPAYHVLDDSNAKFLLLSNRLKSGEKDRNPLSRAILREPPQGIATPLSVNYDNMVELIGVTMPAVAGRGDTFEMTLYFKVLRPVGGNWKIFLHFDGGGLRFQGDHDPIGGRCGTQFWQQGDYIVDTVTVEAGNFTYSKTNYAVLVGFFRGSHGNWKNMDVVSAQTANGSQLEVDANDRVRIAQLRLE